MSDEVTQRDSRGRFVKGNKANPHGNPAHRSANKLRSLLDPHMPELIERLVSAAKAGDMEAMRIIMDRVSPKLRAVAVPVEVPGLAEAETLTDKAMKVLEATGAGQIGTDNAGELLSALGALANIKFADETEQRLLALELKGGSKK